MTAPHQHEIVANFAACRHHDVVTERIMALLLALTVGLAGCGNGDTNFSQEPGFAEYFAKFPPASTGADPAEQVLLRRYRPRFLLPPSHPGMIDFYLDYVPEGHLTDGSGRRVPGPLDRLTLNAHKRDPRAVFVHEPSGLQFLPPDDAFYVFQGFLGERRRIPGRSGPPGASYDIAPALKPRGIQLTAFYWREGDMGDLERLDGVLAQDRGLGAFARLQSEIFYRDWRRISPAPRE